MEQLLFALLSILIAHGIVRAGVKHGTLDAHSALEARRARTDGGTAPGEG